MRATLETVAFDEERHIPCVVFLRIYIKFNGNGIPSMVFFNCSFDVVSRSFDDVSRSFNVLSRSCDVWSCSKRWFNLFSISASKVSTFEFDMFCMKIVICYLSTKQCLYVPVVRSDSRLDAYGKPRYRQVRRGVLGCTKMPL